MANFYFNGAVDGDWARVQAAATGTISFADQLWDGDTVTVNAVVFEFDSNESVAEGNVAAAIGTDLTETLNTLAALIEANATVTASIAAETELTGSRITLVADSAGTAGNFSLSTTAAVARPVSLVNGSDTNWWLDDTYTTPATSLPTSSDYVYVQAAVTSNSGSEPTVGGMSVTASIGIAVTLAADTVALFSTGGANTGAITGDCTFSGTAANYGTITGDATFDGSGSANDYTLGVGTVTGHATFQNGAFNYANVSGTATFLSGSTNSAGGGYAISGNATFDSSFNSGVISGSATFDGYGVNWTGGTVHGGATFNGPSLNYGNVGYTYYSYAQPHTTFNDGSTNYGYAYGQSVTFNHTSANRRNNDSFPGYPGEVWPGADGAFFNDTARNGGHVFGNAVFNDNSYIDRGASTRSYYNDDGIVTGTATFRGASYNKQSCGSVVVEYAKGINGSSILGVL